MLSMVSVTSRLTRSAALAALMLAATALAAAQAPTASAAPATQAKPGTQPPVSYDPTRPEIQPDLSLDHDPILSPDAEDNMAVNPAAPVSERAGALKKGQNGVYTLHEDVDEVLLDCTVVDENGKPVTDLKQADFRVWEDGNPQATNSFQHQDLPVSMGILVDNSGSMLDKRTAVNTAAMNLLQESNPKDAAFIVNFSDRAYLDQGFTSSLADLGRGLAHFDSKGTTALYDAVAASADELSKHARQRKQVLLIVTDGADNASRLGLEQAIRRVQNLGGPVVYSIGLLYDTDKVEAQRARTALDSLSTETGGLAYFPESLKDVNEIASDVARDIRNQYTLGYHSSKPSSIEGYRVIHVEARAPRHGRLTVRTRKGYFARKPAPQPTQTAQDSQPGSTPPHQ